MVFIVPIAVLRDYEQWFDAGERMLCMWWMTWHHIVCVFMPDAVQEEWRGSWQYGRASCEAIVAVGGRMGDFIYGSCLTVMLSLSLAAYLPKLVYDVLEGVFMGWKGVAILLAVSNGWCWFSRTVIIFLGIVIACGCYSRLLYHHEQRLALQ
ncbi:hypothetical protein JG688_00004891 [Phytophthora aleatoria]|uniref:Uncharacterized protein n=1 Tax=Phytophthora aleatoria TaxID=2496075 RepID=A0A8J5J2R7_9STRA|nr:hypothetical protein JG688_00004891 [Phytophthora aleatoria]